MLITAAALVLVVTSLLLVQAVRIHEKYGEWGIRASATPLRMSVLGRDYDRGDLRPGNALPDDVKPAGKTEGGGTILVPADLGDRDPVIVYVKDEQGRVWTYGLVGGP